MGWTTLSHGLPLLAMPAIRRAPPVRSRSLSDRAHTTPHLLRPQVSRRNFDPRT
eukprot:XP_001699469.1 predicted protein [Chlamydomonas reinhardtii]